jgi:plasmid maintenance system antidote protein VapI
LRSSCWQQKNRPAPAQTINPKGDKMKAIFNRFREPSTWAGIAMLATMFGVPASTADAVVKAVAAVCAATAILLPESMK